MPGYADMDTALARLSAQAPDLANGFTNHAPMAIEALCALGRGDQALPWLETNWRYRSLLLPRRAGRHRIADWRAALGNGDSESWSAFLEKDFTLRDWRGAAARWTVQLSPGVAAGALHGVIRAGHAARSLQDEVTALRLAELRDAYGYWAAHYQPLPAADFAGLAGSAARALQRVTPAPPARQRRAGAITAALGVLDADFAPVIGMLDVSGDPAAVLSEMTETFARLYLANAVDPMGVITFIHGVTGAVALRSLMPFLTADEARQTLRYAWQAGAALYAALGVAPPREGPIAAPDQDIPALIDKAVATADEHAIKFTEALLREYAIRPSPAYLAAAAHAISALT